MKLDDCALEVIVEVSMQISVYIAIDVIINVVFWSNEFDWYKYRDIFFLWLEITRRNDIEMILRPDMKSR